MPPPRSIRVLDGTDKEASPRDVHEAMQGYEAAHRVHEMMRVLLTKLLEDQPLDPLTYLIKTLKQDDELDALAHDAHANRFDLRRECTKREALKALYARLLALQQQKQRQSSTRSNHPDTEVASAFLMEQLASDDLHAHLQAEFPKHHRDLAQWFRKHERELPDLLSRRWFLQQTLRVLATQGSM